MEWVYGTFAGFVHFQKALGVAADTDMVNIFYFGRMFTRLFRILFYRYLSTGFWEVRVQLVSLCILRGICGISLYHFCEMEMKIMMECVSRCSLFSFKGTGAQLVRVCCDEVEFYHLFTPAFGLRGRRGNGWNFRIVQVEVWVVRIYVDLGDFPSIRHCLI